MNKIIELAHVLGEAIAESEEMKKVASTKDAFDSDAALQAQLAEYEAERKLLADEFNKDEDEMDKQVIEALKEKLDELGKVILQNPVYSAFSDAQKAMNDLMGEVNDEIKFCITGERPTHCTHDCSTCAGCHG